MEALATPSMDIRDLEKDELVDLAGMLGARLTRKRA